MKELNAIKVVKRDGKVVSYDNNKIFIAIKAALGAIGVVEGVAEYAKQLAEEADEAILAFDTSELTVEMVQDAVVSVLVATGNQKLYTAYIEYRYRHTQLREIKNAHTDPIHLIDEYINRNTWKINENASMQFSLQGMNNYIIESMTKEYYKQKILSPQAVKMHDDAFMHIHDLGLLATYCCGWDLKDLLIKGFRGVAGKTSSKPAAHFDVALMQLVNFIFTLQGESSGAQAVSNFDTYLAPLVAHDNLNYAQVKAAMEQFIYNMNVNTRVGFQSPFFNLTMDLTCPDMLKDENVIIKGKPQKETYSMFQEQMDMINRAFCELMTEGDADGRNFPYPIPTYNITKETDWKGLAMRNVAEMTAKYGIPYFSNFINSDMSPEDARSMCCRLRLDNRVLRKRGGGLFGANPKTGSVGVVTLNLASLGYRNKGNKQALFQELYTICETAKSTLVSKRAFLDQVTPLGLYPYTSFYLRDVYEETGSYWSNHFLTIATHAGHEMCLNFMGKGIETPEGLALSEEVLDYLNNLLVIYQEETGYLFNLEAAPAESTSYRLALRDRELYPDIITAGEETPYYTNSTHLPVGYATDIFQVFDHQDNLQTKYTGGTVIHGFIGERLEDIDATIELIKTLAENYRVPYYTITPTYSICTDHGYLQGEQHNCPYCNKVTEVWTRIVGFHRPVSNWNPGKKAEFKDRKTYTV